MTASTKLSAAQAKTAQFIQEARMAPGLPTAWLSVSSVMALVQIESDFDATIKGSDYATTGSIGLLQVTTTTVEQVRQKFGSQINLPKPQTDPYTSIMTGMLYLSICRDMLIPVFGEPLAFAHVCIAYNYGPGGSKVFSLKEAVAQPYYLKWASAQRSYAFLDDLLGPAATPVPPVSSFPAVLKDEVLGEPILPLSTALSSFTNPTGNVKEDTSRLRQLIAAVLEPSFKNLRQRLLFNSEAEQNALLAYRHLEDSRLRLGKILQALEGGSSKYLR